MANPIIVDNLSGNGYDFALLHNALLAAGYSNATALEYAAKVYGEGIRVECKAK